MSERQVAGGDGDPSKASASPAAVVRIRGLMALGLPRMDKAVLLAPAAMARAAAYGARRPEERWLLHQARPTSG